jgi:hypothetical protein
LTNKPRKNRRQIIGWREWVGLPELGVDKIKAKIDTGARTSAIHAWNISELEGPDGPWVSFDLHPVQRENRTVVPCRAAVADMRTIRSSSGEEERRYIIRTRLRLGPRSWLIDLSLTNRDEMGFRILLGRAAVRRRIIVDPGRSFLIPRPSDWQDQKS